MDINLNIFDEQISGTNTKPLSQKTVYDIIVIGGGPAAMTSAVYAMRKGMKTALIAKNIGGQVAETVGIENYLGFNYIEGSQLVTKFSEQVTQFEIAFARNQLVEKVSLGKDAKIVHLQNGKKYRTRSVIVATGASWKHLGIPGEKELTGKGVAFCATCDAPFFQNKKVTVVGGGNSGVEAAIDLAKVAKSVMLVEYATELKADEILQNKLAEFSNVEIKTNHTITKIIGKDEVEKIVVLNRKTKCESTREMDGVFIQIGLTPNSKLVEDIVALGNFNEILIDCECKTNVPGIFAAGDVTSVPYKQIIIAGGEGAKAALSAYNYVLKTK
jgi:alkyl hydroperoxide reductase subunit F